MCCLRLYCFGEANAPSGNEDPTAGCANNMGTGAVLIGTGSTSVSADDLELTAYGVDTSGDVPDSFPVLLHGADRASTDSVRQRTMSDTDLSLRAVT